jgi:nucleoside-diphosphate-sugar epimerase
MNDPFGARVDRLLADRSTDGFASALSGRSFDACVDFAVYNGPEVERTVRILHGRVGHYVMISTGQVYLVRVDCPRPAREADYDGPLIAAPDDPVEHEEWSYGFNKRHAEDVLTAAWAEAKFPSTRLRIPMVNGERDYHRRIEGYLWRLLDGGPLVMPGGGGHRVRHVYAGAVVRAIADLLGNSDTFGQAYNLAQNETPSLAEMIRMLADLLGARVELVAVPVDVVRGAGLDVVSVSTFSGRWMSFLDPARARLELGFRHEPLELYLDKVVTCFLNHPPEGPPDGYRLRPVELRLAASWVV